MAESDAPDKEDPTGAEGHEGEEGLNPPPSGFAKHKKMVFLAVGALLLLIGGGAAGYVVSSGKSGGEAGEHSEAEAAAATNESPKTGEASAGAPAGAPVFLSLGDILVNLSGDGKRPNFLKMKISLDLADEKDKAAIEAMKPRIIDNFQVYLRELRIEDLRGSAGLQRLREELLLRVAEITAPIRVREVLFQEMLVQ